MIKNKGHSSGESTRISPLVFSFICAPLVALVLAMMVSFNLIKIESPYLTISPGESSQQEKEQATEYSTYTNDSNDITIPQKALEILKGKYSPNSFVIKRWNEQHYGMEAIMIEKNGNAVYEEEFDHEGNLLETEWENPPHTEIPELVVQQVKQDYPGCVIIEREIETTYIERYKKIANGKKIYTPPGTYYELELKWGLHPNIEVYYTADGQKAYNYFED